MAHIPPPHNPEWTRLPWSSEPYAPSLSITVYALRENKRPVGFAPWPEEPKPKKKRKRKKREDAA